MKIVDKNNILSRLDKIPELHLELGCGNRKKNPDHIGIDLLDYDCVDIVGDVFEVIKLFPDSSVASVSAFHFLEHIDDPQALLQELQRITRKNGLLEIVVPHFSNPHYYSDLTHKSSYGLYTFSYMCSCSLFRREVPSYETKYEYKLINVELVFKSSPPFYFRHAIKKFFGFLFNLNTYTKELYEENLCYIFPCYEIRYKMRRN